MKLWLYWDRQKVLFFLPPRMIFCLNLHHKAKLPPQDEGGAVAEWSKALLVRENK